MPEPIKKFYRSRSDRVIFGVCGGLANYFRVDPTLVRVAFLLLTFLSGVGILIYIILAIIAPLEAGSSLKSDSARIFARKINDQAYELAEEIKTKKHLGKNFLGLSVLILGVLLLARYYFGLLLNWNLLSPVLIVILGIYLIIKHK